MAKTASISGLTAETAKLSVEDIAPGISPAQRFAPRPGYGTIGRPITVRANYFAVNFPESNIVHYDVVIDPDVPPSIGRQVLMLVQNQHLRTRVAFDGRKNLYASRDLPMVGDNVVNFDVNLQDEGQVPPRPRPFRVTIKKVATVNLAMLHEFVAGRLRTMVPYEAIQALDVVLRQQGASMFSVVGRSLFSETGRKPLGGGVEAWTGFHQSLRPLTGRLALNVDVSAATYYESGPTIQVVMRLLNMRDENSLRNLGRFEMTQLEKFFKGTKVQITYRGEMRRKYRVIGLTAGDASRETFRLEEENRDISVADFFQRQYNIHLRFPFLPCLKVGSPRRAVMIPMEVTEMVPGDRYTRKLSPEQTANMIKVSTQLPRDRASKIVSGIKTLQLHDAENPYMEEFGLEVSPTLMAVRARVLEPPPLEYNPRSRDAKFIPHGGVWNMRDKVVNEGCTIQSWSVIVFGSRREFPEPMVERFFGEMIATGQSMGVRFEGRRPSFCTWAPPNIAGVENELKQALAAARQTTGMDAQIIFCILPSTDTPFYASIKRAGDTIVGVPTQCMQGRHMQRPNRQYCANVLLKVNVRMYGTNVRLATQIPALQQEPTIIIGADVTHPGPTESHKPSVCAMVGSLDSQATRFSASVKVQRGGKEIISEMQRMVIELMREYYRTTKTKPSRIIFYRDGVSEGQFQEVVFREISAIRMACATLESGYQPKVTFIIVQKRHHVRFFPENRNDADRNGNLLAGSVIDMDVTHPTEFDFFLCSHASIQGTSRPTHYYVLVDENGFSSDNLQKLTYDFCYTYAKSTRAVSICTPAYYADLLAFRGRYYSPAYAEDTATVTSGSGGAGSIIESFRMPTPTMKNRMFFL